MRVKLPDGAVSNEVLYGLKFENGISAEFNDSYLLARLKRHGYIEVEENKAEPRKTDVKAPRKKVAKKEVG